MGFQFGILSEVSLDIGTEGFVTVVVFVAVFEYLTHYIDYMKDYYPAAYHMIHKVYKELMRPTKHLIPIHLNSLKILNQQPLKTFLSLPPSQLITNYPEHAYSLRGEDGRFFWWPPVIDQYRTLFIFAPSSSFYFITDGGSPRPYCYTNIC